MLNINIENEYSRLKTVILGIADNLGNPPSESDAFDPRSLYHIKNNSYPLEKDLKKEVESFKKKLTKHNVEVIRPNNVCLLYTSPSPRDISGSRMPSSA